MCASLFFIINVSSYFFSHTHKRIPAFILSSPSGESQGFTFICCWIYQQLIVGNTFFFFEIFFYFCLQQLDAMNLNIHIATHLAIATRLFGKKKETHDLLEKELDIYSIPCPAEYNQRQPRFLSYAWRCQRDSGHPISER
jgi:hypothetical protein